MIGLDPSQPQEIHSAIPRQRESFRRVGVPDTGSSHENNVELEVLGRHDLNNGTAPPEGEDLTHFPRRKAKHPSDLSAISRWWYQHVELSVEYKACRDHLGMLLSETACVDVLRSGCLWFDTHIQRLNALISLI